MKFLQMNEDKSYKLVEANGTLKTMQKIVGGLVERIYYLSDLEERNIDMWCNEEGETLGLSDSDISYILANYRTNMICI